MKKKQKKFPKKPEDIFEQSFRPPGFQYFLNFFWRKKTCFEFSQKSFRRTKQEVLFFLFTGYAPILKNKKFKHKIDK